MERIRVTVSTVYEYKPDLDEDFYVSNDVTTIQAAAELDLEELRQSKVSIDELGDVAVSVGYHMEIFDDGLE